MKFTHIRNATALLNYAGKTFLIDPMLSEKGAFPGFPMTVNNHLRNPLAELPMPIKDIINVDAVIITHTHPDHWDDVAINMIPKDIPIFSQHEQDKALIWSQGFTNITLLSDNPTFNGVSMTKTVCQHGTKEIYANPQIAKIAAEACGIVFQHPDEKTVYLVGDTIWIPKVAETMKKFTPNVIILNTGYAQLIGFDGSLIMGKDDVVRTHDIAPQATIVTVHMEAVNHCMLSRKELSEFVKEKGIQKSIRIPEDGESLVF